MPGMYTEWTSLGIQEMYTPGDIHLPSSDANTCDTRPVGRGVTAEILTRGGEQVKYGQGRHLHYIQWQPCAELCHSLLTN